MPALERVATTPEKFSEKERLTIVRLLEAALLADDAKLSTHAAEVGIALVGENQRRGQELWPTGE